MAISCEKRPQENSNEVLGNIRHLQIGHRSLGLTPDEQAKWGEDAKCAVRKGNELTRSSTTES